MDSVLVLGVNCRPVAFSAKRLGLRVVVVDYFGDQDLASCVDKAYSIRQQRVGESLGDIDSDYSAEKLLELAKRAVEEEDVHLALACSGVASDSKHVKELEGFCEVLGNTSEKVEGVRNWEKFSKRLDSLGIPHPETFVADSAQGVEKYCSKLEFPLVVKPTKDTMGFGVRIVNSVDEALEAFGDLGGGKCLVQEFIEGVDASVSFLGTGEKAAAVSLNEQLLGLSVLGCREGFIYCGNIVPLEHNLRNECFSIAEAVGEEFGLVGSNGIDMVLGEEPYVVEVNPRFQDTLETIEHATCCNLVEQHLAACDGVLSKPRGPEGFWLKALLYADRRYRVGDYGSFDCVGDVSLPGSIVERGNPVCSLLVCEGNRKAVFDKMLVRVGELKSLLTPV